MKKILHILLISCFSFTIISCAEINSTMNDISAKYDDISKEADETEKTSVKAEQATNSTISEKQPSFLFVHLVPSEEVMIVPL